MGAVLLIAATRRRSAVSSEETVGALDEVVRQRGVLRSAAIASSSLRRCPSALTPRSLRSSAVRLGRTVLPVTDVPIRAEPPARCDRTRHWIKATRIIFV